MEQYAPSCQYPGCERKTWSGLCWQHVNMQGRPADPQNLALIPNGDHPVANPYQIAAASRAVFPDLPDEPSPADLRDQARGALSAAVSVEVYRIFPISDLDDIDSRQRVLTMMVGTMMRGLAIQPTDVSDQDAVAISRSSSDRWGRTLDDSACMASYGLRQEWELARSLRKSVDPTGVPYEPTYEAFCSRVGTEMMGVVNNETAAQLRRYSSVIREVSGRNPLIPSPDMLRQETPKPTFMDVIGALTENSTPRPTAQQRKASRAAAQAAADERVEAQRARETAETRQKEEDQLRRQLIDATKPVGFFGRR